MKYGFSFSSRILKSLSVVLPVCTLAVTLLGACTPNPVARQYGEANNEFGPQREDPFGNFDQVKPGALPTAEAFNFSGRISTATLYRSIEDLSLLSRLTNEPDLGRLSFLMREAVIKSTVPWQHTVQYSAYTSAAIGETQKDTEKAVDTGAKMLEAQEPIILELLKKRSEKTTWPSQTVRIDEVMKYVGDFVDGLKPDLELSDLDSAVKTRMVQEIRITFQPLIERLRLEFEAAYQEKRFDAFLTRVRKALEVEKIELGKDTLSRLKLAEQLTRNVETIDNSRSALAVVIDFWKASSPQIRETEFKAASPELYDYLDGKSDSDLDCIKTSCGLITRIAKALFILPAIEEFGVQKLKSKLRKSAKTAILTELETTATQFLTTLHEEIGRQVLIELRKQKDAVQKIAVDYGSYMRLIFNRMALAKLGLREKDSFSGLEPSQIDYQMDFTGRGVLRASRIEKKANSSNTANSQNSVFTSGSEVLGTGMTAALVEFENHMESELRSRGRSFISIDQAMSRVLFEQINKALMVGGFVGEDQKPFDSLSVSIDRDQATVKRYNVQKQISSPLTFAVPDRLLLEAPTQSERVLGTQIEAPLKVSVLGQAEVLKGLSRLAIQLKDWQPSKFDDSLGRVNLADYVPDLPRETVSRSLFPKDVLYAAAIGNAASILKNVQKKASSLALLTSDLKLTWLGATAGAGFGVGSSSRASAMGPLAPSASGPGGASKAEDSESGTMATVFDVIEGDPSTVVKTADVAKFLSALTEFLKAIEGVEKTQAGPLVQPALNQERPVEQLVESRQSVKLLIMALANFLSSEMIDRNGLVLPLFERRSRTESRDSDKWVVAAEARPKGVPRLLDQAMVIRALLDASDALSAKVYRFTAADILASMNSQLFKPELAFYANGLNENRRPDLATMVATLVAGQRLMGDLDSSRQANWKRMTAPWFHSLKDAISRLK